MKRDSLTIRTRLATPVLLALGAASLLAACKTIDHTKLEADIQADTAKQGLNLASVSCPADQPLREGTKVACTCTDKQGTQGTFDVEIANGHGRVEWKLRGKFMNMRIVGDSLEAKLGKRLNQVVDVVCPSDNILIKKDVSFTCDVKVGAKDEQITLTAKADDGTSWDEKIVTKS